MNKIIIALSLLVWFSQDLSAQELSKRQAFVLSTQLDKEKRDTAKFTLLLKLAWYQVLKPGELKADLDTTKDYLSKAGALLGKIHAAGSIGFYDLVYSDYLNEAGQKKISQEVLEKALTKLKDGGDKFLLGNAYQEKMNRLELSPANTAEKIRLLRLAADAYSTAGDKRKYGDCLRLLADMQTFVNNNSDAVLLELDSAKKLYQQAGSGDWQQLYVIYSRHYLMQNDYNRALEAILNARRLIESKDSTMQECELDYQAATLYLILKDYRNALFYGTNALLIAEKNNSIANVYEVSLILARTYAGFGLPKQGLKMLDGIDAKFPSVKLDEKSKAYYLARLTIYTELRVFPKGQIYYNRLIPYITAQNGMVNANLANSCLGTMTKFCIVTGQYAKAENLIATWQAVIKRLGSTSYLRSRILSARLTLEAERKNYKAALDYSLKIGALNDSVFNEARMRDMREMEVRYQTERKENENNLQKQKILTLNEQHKVEQAELKTVGFTKNITLASALCMMVIAGFIYRQYVEGRKTNTLIDEKNKRLERLLNENEWLMKEVHHRVKNNLQIISSLLNSQSAYMENGAAVDAILKSKGRVESISLIHQKLYRSENQSSVYMPEYIQDLVQYLKDSFVEEQTVFFDLAIDSLSLDVADAVPLGLIINESVTNAIKHAFGIKSDNVIDIKLRKTETDIILTIRDNGKGFDFHKPRENSSFGLLLINGLAEDLEGKLDITNNDGTVICLSFKPTSLSNATYRQQLAL